MPLVYGQIDSLKRIREILDDRGISRFNSTGDINRFIKSYERHKEEVLFKVEHEYELELDRLLEQKDALQQGYRITKTAVEEPLLKRINSLTAQCEAASSAESKNPVVEVLHWYKYIILKAVLFGYKNSFKRVVSLRTKEKLQSLKAIERSVESFYANRQKIISDRYDAKLQELEYTREVAKGLDPLIAGAIGENLVAQELQKISATSVLFNDFKVNFHPPIYYKKEHQRIRSIQLDHLLVTKAGIFIIETKNWSKKSLRRYDLRSPVSQMQRSNYALYVLLNGQRSNVQAYINHHHWGTREIPIRNILAMIHHKPQETFRFVAIKKLEELNDYINFFEPVFEDAEVIGIADYLKGVGRS